jgi:pimeloyl-ACP methyl ester carboxylesterase
MQRAGYMRAGWLLVAAGLSLSAGCSDDDSPDVDRDAGAASAADAGSSTPEPFDGSTTPTPTKDSGPTPTPRDSGRDVTPSRDGGPTPELSDGGDIDAGVDGAVASDAAPAAPIDAAVADARADAGPPVDAAAVIANVVLPRPEDAGGPEVTGQCGAMVNEANCDESKLPIVFVHGTVANADSFAHPAKLFASNGYCASRIRGIEYHSLIGVPDAGTFTLDSEATYAAAKAAIDQEIARLQEQLGVTKVDLAGHSQGAAHGARYARENPAKVAHYLHLAGRELTEDPGGVATLSLSSIGDRPLNSKTTANVVFQDQWLDHSAVASSTESFVEMYKFLNDGEQPRYQTVRCGMPIILEGRAQTFADNSPLPGGRIEIHEVGDAPRATNATPVASYQLENNGSWGPFTARRNVAYEFKLVPPPGDTTRRPSHIYLPPFVRSDRLLRFNFETKDPIAGATSMKVNRDDSFAVIIPRSRQKAFLAERDSLAVDGFQILTRANTLTVEAGKAKSAVEVAFYLFDKSLTDPAYGPGDRTTTGETVVNGSFVNSADVYIPAATPKLVDVTYNGRTLKVQNWPSATEGTSVVMIN